MKIHILSNSLRINSGFSVVARNVGTGLKKLGHQITMTSMQTAYVPEFAYGIEMIPIQTFYIDDVSQYMLSLQRINPDVVLCIFQADSEFNNWPKVFAKSVWYPPVEGKRVPDAMAADLAQVKKNGGEIVAQTKYGQSEMKLVGLDVPYIYHGFDDKIFRPIDLKKNNHNNLRHCYYKTDYGKVLSDPLLLHRQGCYDCELDIENQSKCPYYSEEHIAILRLINNKWTEESIPIADLSNISKGKFVFGFVGQNLGVRKRIERLLKAYSIFLGDSRKLKDRTILHLHTMPIAINGINLIRVVHDLGLQNNVIFSYGTFRSSAWSEQAISILYNTFDINTSASSSEGFCILPDSPILTLYRGVQKIKDIKIGDKVLTHKGRFMRVSQVMKREYNGDMVRIIPHKLGSITLTPEHRILGIKTVPCTNKSGNTIKTKSMCKPGQCYYIKNGIQYKWCKYINGDEPYRKYNTEWICAENIEIGDLLTYPRINENIVDIDEIKIRDYIDDFLNVTGGEYNDNTVQSDLFGGFIEDTICMNATYSKKYAKIPAKIKLDENLMRLFGYFIAEGDIAAERQIEFSFNLNEIEYIEDVERIMKEKFGLNAEHIIGKKINDKNINVHVLRYSNTVLANMFRNMFCPKEYITKKGKGSKSNIVRIPSEFLNLPLKKLAELIKAEWRGDGTDSYEGRGYGITTTSETLAHQLLYILSKFGILASLRAHEWNHRQNDKWSIKYNIDIHGKDAKVFENIICQEKYVYIKEEKDNKYLKGKNFYYIPIKNIEIIKYNGYVYNLEVEEDNSYISSIITHNCLPVLEGMASGIPMIAPNCSAFTELIDENEGKGGNNPRGLLADIIDWQMTPDGSIRALVDEKDLANKMKILYSDEDLRNKYSKNTIKFASNYTWNKIVDQWDRLLTTI